MGDTFDPYHEWLAIPPKEQPPNHYRLLNVRLFEDLPSVIRSAAAARAEHVVKYQLSKRAKECQDLLGEIAAASVCLGNPEKKAAYDARLRAELGGKESLPTKKKPEGTKPQPSDQLDDLLDPLDDLLDPLDDLPDPLDRQPGPLDRQPGPLDRPPTKLLSRRQGIGVAIGFAFGALALGGLLMVILSGIGGGSPPASALVFEWPEADRREAELFVNGESRPVPPVGPYKHVCPPGEYLVVATRPGCEPFEETVNVEADEEKTISPVWQESVEEPVAAGPDREATAADTDLEEEPRSDDGDRMPEKEDVPPPDDMKPEPALAQSGTDPNPDAAAQPPMPPPDRVQMSPPAVASSDDPSPRPEPLTPAQAAMREGAHVPPGFVQPGVAALPVAGASIPASTTPHDVTAQAGAANEDAIVLASGKTFKREEYSIDVNAVEALIKSWFANEDSGTVVRAIYTGRFSAAYLQPGRQLNGLVAAFHDEDTLMMYATYSAGKRHGLLKYWDDEGNDVYWCQYSAGQRDGVCCFFEKDELRMVSECAKDKFTSIVVVSDGKQVKRFEGPELAVGDQLTGSVMVAADKIEADIKEIERIMVLKINNDIREREQEKRQKLASAQAPGKRAAIIGRESGRRAMENANLGALKRQSGY